jgi:hypothetical protein
MQQLGFPATGKANKRVDLHLGADAAATCPSSLYMSFSLCTLHRLDAYSVLDRYSLHVAQCMRLHFQGALQGCACELACEGEMQHQLCVLLSACDLAFAQEQQLQWLPEHHLCI